MISAASTKDAGHSGIDVLVAGIRVPLKQGVGGEDLPALAVAALGNVLVVPGFLNWMITGGTQAFDCGDLRACHADRGHDAGTHGNAID